MRSSVDARGRGRGRPAPRRSRASRWGRCRRARRRRVGRRGTRSSGRCPPGIATPMLSGWSSARSGGRQAIRAVASVCAVHHDEVPARALRPERPSARTPVGREPAAGLGDWRSVGRSRSVEAASGRAGRRCSGTPANDVAPVPANRSQKHSSTTGGRSARARRRPARWLCSDRQAVAVVQRQRRDRPVVGGEPRGSRRWLAALLRDVVVGEPHQLGRAGRAGGAQQQREVGVQVVRGRASRRTSSRAPSRRRPRRGRRRR